MSSTAGCVCGVGMLELELGFASGSSVWVRAAEPALSCACYNLPSNLMLPLSRALHPNAYPLPMPQLSLVDNTDCPRRSSYGGITITILSTAKLAYSPHSTHRCSWWRRAAPALYKSRPERPACSTLRLERCIPPKALSGMLSCRNHEYLQPHPHCC